MQQCVECIQLYAEVFGGGKMNQLVLPGDSMIDNGTYVGAGEPDRRAVTGWAVS